MGFHAVSLGYTVSHGDFTNFINLLFSSVTLGIDTESGKQTITFVPHTDVTYDKSRSKEPITIQLVDEERYDTVESAYHDSAVHPVMCCDYDWTIYHEGRTYTVGGGHCCSYGIVLATVGDDCGGEEAPAQFTIRRMRKFCDFLEWLVLEGRLGEGAVPVLTMSGNCCS